MFEGLGVGKGVLFLVGGFSVLGMWGRGVDGSRAISKYVAELLTLRPGIRFA